MDDWVNLYLQQPQTLENLALKKVAAWIASLAGEITSETENTASASEDTASETDGLASKMKELALKMKEKAPETEEAGSESMKLALETTAKEEGVGSPISKYQSKLEDLLSQQIEMIRNHLKCKLPGVFYDTLAAELIKQSTRSLLVSRCWGQKYRPRAGPRTGRMIETLFTINLTSLSLHDHRFWKIYRDPFCSKAFMLTGLVYLNITLDPESPTVTEADILKMFEQLRNLRHVTLTRVSTNNIVKCMAENNTSIETLELFNSKITDDCVDALIKLTNLTRVGLTETDVTEAGVEKLLMHCEKIEHIHADFNIIQILQHIASFEGNLRNRFKLKSYDDHFVHTLEEMQSIVELCPSIENMTLREYTCRVHYIHVINGLQHLRELSLEEYDADAMTELLAERGRGLQHLELEEIYVDVNALKYICMNCPNLESLTIINCYCDYGEPFALKFGSETPVPPLGNVKRLVFAEQQGSAAWSRGEELVFLLSNCPNVEYIVAREMYALTDDVIMTVLETNPKALMHLKNLISWKLTAPALDLIVQNCVNPPVVENY